jgi:hypothetical protein
MSIAMKTSRILAIAILFIAGVASAKPADDVKFYAIALTCSSAPKLGCGSRAKRVLATLTGDSRVAAAWVNEGGTILAVRWNEPSAPFKAQQLNDILGANGLAINPTDENTHGKLLASFRTNKGWFDARSIDELSKKESAVIAERMVKRLQKRVPVTPTQSSALVKAIMSSCWDRGGCQVEKDVTAIAQSAKLDGSVVEAWREVVALGYLPRDTDE